MAKSITVNSPIDDAPVGEVSAMSVADVAAKLTTAAKAQPSWADWSAEERGKVLRAAAAAMREHADELGELLVREIGKTPSEGHVEITRTADLVDYTVTVAGDLAEYEHRAAEFPNTEAGRVQTVLREPLGVVVAIAPFNYPINLAVSKIAPALMMGNTVVFKPPTQGSVAGTRLVALWHEAGVPADVLQLVTGSGSEVGDALVTAPETSMVALTGSTAVGQGVAAKAGMIPLLLELGGNDPAIVLADADLDRAAECVAAGAWKYSGQRCTAIKRVYVEASVADSFVSKLKAVRDADYGSAGDPREHPVGPVISDKQADYLEELYNEAAKEGDVVAGGKRSGRVWEATIIDTLSHGSRLVQEEQFGPLLPIVRVSDVDEAIRLANDSAYGLQACLFTTRDDAASLARQLQVGGVHLNDPDQRGPDNFLFVGHKDSGLGPQGVRYSLEGMSRLKGIVRADS